MQTQDIMMAKSAIQEAEAHVYEALKYADNRQVARDVIRRVEDWRGLIISQFGHLVMYDLVTITNNRLTKPVSDQDELFQRSRTMAQTATVPSLSFPSDFDRLQRGQSRSRFTETFLFQEERGYSSSIADKVTPQRANILVESSRRYYRILFRYKYFGLSCLRFG